MLEGLSIGVLACMDRTIRQYTDLVKSECPDVIFGTWITDDRIGKRLHMELRKDGDSSRRFFDICLIQKRVESVSLTNKSSRPCHYVTDIPTLEEGIRYGIYRMCRDADVQFSLSKVWH